MASCFFLLCVVSLVFRSCCSMRSPEWFQNISTDLFSYPGDINLGGLFPIQQAKNISRIIAPNSIKCESLNELGLGLALVMKFAVDEINGNQSLLPGIKLGYKIYDTCSQSSIIVKPTLSFLTAKTSHALSVECNYTDYETSMSAVIGPYTSEMVSVIGKLLGFFLMPQISYGATSDTFSDSLLYPSFFRTVPSDKWQVDAMARLMKEFGWNWVAVIGSDEAYGQQGVQQFSKSAENMSICVAYQSLIPVYTDSKPAVKTIIDNIIATEVKVVLLFSLADPAVSFFEEVSERHFQNSSHVDALLRTVFPFTLFQVINNNLTGVWIASSSWVIHNRVMSIPNIHKIGTVIGFIEKLETLELLVPYMQELLAKLSLKASSPNLSTGNPDDPCPQCWDLSPANISLVTNTLVQRLAFAVYAAVYSAAKALHNMLECNSTLCKWDSNTKIYPWKLLEVLRNTSTDINGTKLEFDANGNPNVGYSLIQWIWESSVVNFKNVGSYCKNELSLNKSNIQWHTQNSEAPNSTCSANCQSGQVRRVKGFQSCCYDCIDCVAGTFQKNEDDILCTPCPDRQWSIPRSTTCTPPSFAFLAWNSVEALEILLMLILLLMCEVSIFALFLKHRGTPLVKAAGGVLTFVSLLSLMGGSLSLMLFLGQPGDMLCHLQLPLITIFQTVAVSITLSISLQIFVVTEFPKKVAPHLQALRGPGSWLFILICCSVQAGLCGWFVLEEDSLSELLANMEINFVNSFLSCPAASDKLAVMQGFNGAMALVSFMSSFMAVKPLHQYNLARDITFSTLIYCVIWVVFIPVYTGLKTSSTTGSKDLSMVHVFFTFAANFGLVVAYYFPKCFLLLRRADLNKPELFCTFLEGVPPTASQEDPQPQMELN
nr:taste receptor type 1 member 3 [Nothobranchius furzeri]